MHVYNKNYFIYTTHNITNKQTSKHTHIVERQSIYFFAGELNKQHQIDVIPKKKTKRNKNSIIMNVDNKQTNKCKKKN